LREVGVEVLGWIFLRGRCGCGCGRGGGESGVREEEVVGGEREGKGEVEKMHEEAFGKNAGIDTIMLRGGLGLPKTQRERWGRRWYCCYFWKEEEERCDALGKGRDEGD